METKVRILDFKEVAKGIKLCLDNSKSLVEEAQILHSNRRYRGSLILALFAWEECAKITEIFNLLEPVNRNDIQKKWKVFYKKFHSHEAKLISSLTNKVIRDIKETGGEGIKKVEELKPVKTRLSLINIKEACLYVGCNFNNKKFVEIHNISEDISAGIIRDVNQEIKLYRLFDNHTIEGITEELEFHAGDEYWIKRPFENETNIIKDKLKEIMGSVK